MGDENTCYADLVDGFAEPCAEFLADFRVDSCERLVKQQKFRLGSERPCEGYSLALTAAQLIGVALAHVREPYQFQKLLHPVGDELLALFLDLQTVGDVRVHRHEREQCVVLEYEPDTAFAGGNRVDVPAVYADVAAVLLFKSGEHSEDRGLSAAAGAEKSDQLALFKSEAHVVGRLEIAEAFVYIF